MIRHPRSIAIAALVAAIALALPTRGAHAETPTETAPAGSPEAATPAPMAPLSEGVIRLRRGGPSIDLDSILDSNQPDFYLNVDIPAPEPTLSPAPSPTPSPAPSVEPSIAPATGSPEAVSGATPSPKPAKSASDLMYQAQRLATLGQYRKALLAADEAIAQDETVAALHAVRGSLLVKLRDYPGAEEAWDRALVLDPGARDVKAGLDWLRKRLAATSSAQ